MRYKPEWKGRLRVDNYVVHWDGVEIGRLTPVHREGAKSPRGLPTNTVFVATNHTEERTFQSATECLEWLISQQGEQRDSAH